jgi:hypothetical protein
VAKALSASWLYEMNASYFRGRRAKAHGLSRSPADDTPCEPAARFLLDARTLRYVLAWFGVGEEPQNLGGVQRGQGASENCLTLGRVIQRASVV